MKFDGPLVTSFAVHRSSRSLSPSLPSVPAGSGTRTRTVVSSFKVPEDRMVPTSSPTMGVARAMVTMQAIATAPIKIRDLMDMVIPSNEECGFRSDLFDLDRVRLYL